MKKVFAMAAIALFMASCSDDSSDATNNGNDTVLVKKMVDVISGQATTSILTYDGNKLLSLVSDDDTHTEYTYANGLLVKEESFDGTWMHNTVALIYDANNKLTSSIETDFYEDGETFAEKNVYTYNSNGTINVDIYAGDKDAQTELTGTGLVTLINGNITKYVYTAADAPAEVTTTTFDSNNSPFRNVVGHEALTLAMLEGGNNNMLINDRPGSLFDFEYSYIYNDAGYPTKETSHWNGNLEYETEYFYE